MSVFGNPPGKAKIPWGIEIRLIRFTFQTPGSVSWKPNDQAVTDVPPSIVPVDELRLPLVKTRNSAVPLRACRMALMCKSLIWTKSKWKRLSLTRIKARVSSSESAVSSCKYCTFGARCAITPSASEVDTARRRS